MAGWRRSSILIAKKPTFWTTAQFRQKSRRCTMCNSRCYGCLRFCCQSDVADWWTDSVPTCCLPEADCSTGWGGAPTQHTPSCWPSRGVVEWLSTRSNSVKGVSRRCLVAAFLFSLRRFRRARRRTPNLNFHFVRRSLQDTPCARICRSLRNRIFLNTITFTVAHLCSLVHKHLCIYIYICCLDSPI